MSSAELNGANYSFRLNRCSSMFLTFMMQKNVSLSKQNWALPAAFGELYYREIDD